MRTQPHLLPADPAAPFPPAADALADPEGLLAVGGDLSPERLLNAYRAGVFPWFSAGQPPLWWTPDPRMVFRTDAVRLSSRFRRSLRSRPSRVVADTAFAEVVSACADVPRPGQRGTWILPAIQAAYGELHRRGHAHSIEVFDGERLVGGMYGVALGRMFFGESMFSAASGGSKVALAALAARLHAWGWPLIDAQVENAHLRRLGAEALPRAAFLDRLARLVSAPGLERRWTEAFGEFPAAALGRP